MGFEKDRGNNKKRKAAASQGRSKIFGNKWDDSVFCIGLEQRQGRKFAMEGPTCTS